MNSKKISRVSKYDGAASGETVLSSSHLISSVILSGTFWFWQSALALPLQSWVFQLAPQFILVASAASFAPFPSLLPYALFSLLCVWFLSQQVFKASFFPRGLGQKPHQKNNPCWFQEHFLVCSYVLTWQELTLENLPISFSRQCSQFWARIPGTLLL